TMRFIATQRSGILKIVTRRASRNRVSSDSPWNCCIAASRFKRTGSLMGLSEISEIAMAPPYSTIPRPILISLAPCTAALWQQLAASHVLRCDLAVRITDGNVLISGLAVVRVVNGDRGDN